MQALRRRIEQTVLDISMSAANPVQIDFDRPAGDPGLFGPASACWRVHSDFTAMFAGGIAALLLQALHPLALAGVWDHSTFRTDMLGRLRRTAQFVAGTTFAGRADAERLIARVRRIHETVHGTAPDGRAYAAADPALLTWVHAAEVSSFLAAYLRHRDPALPGHRQDDYLREYACVARALGAVDVPACRADMAAYLQAMRAQLHCDARTLEVLRLLRRAPAPGPAALVWARLMTRAGVELLPGWALAMLGRRPMGPAARMALDTAVQAAAQPLRWAVRNGSAHRARRRVAGIPPPP